MPSLIEQAAARLAQLQQTGAPIPGLPLPPGSVAAARPADWPRLVQAVPSVVDVIPTAAPVTSPTVAPTVVPGMPASAPMASVAAAAATPIPAASPIAPGYGGPQASPSAEPAVAQSRRVELNLPELVARGFIPPNATPGLTTDEFRVIKRPLINNALGRGVPKVHHGNLIMMTSAMPGEGKTFTAINLALSIAAEMDSTVLLVDADVANPSVQSTLGMEPGLGLLDVLGGRCTMAEAIVRTNIDKFTVMHAGTPQDRATEMLGSSAMMQLLEQMASRYSDRVVVFDLPPLLLATEARVMASHAGQLVVVVRAHHTTESQLQHALATVEQVPVKMAILNQATSSDQAEFGYGYGYGRRYAARPEARRSGRGPVPAGVSAATDAELASGAA